MGNRNCPLSQAKNMVKIYSVGADMQNYSPPVASEVPVIEVKASSIIE
jgi:hypothetical protein